MIANQDRHPPTSPALVGWVLAYMMGVLLGDGAAIGDVISVSSDVEFSQALGAASPGDIISISPGVYNGGLFRSGLSDVVIRGSDPNARPIIRGGINGIQLSNATGVTLEDLIFEQQTGNGLNIDDGGTFATPTTDVTIRRVLVRDLATAGNRDGIKLSGVTGFLIDGVAVENWGTGGSAIDPVGSHNGVIQNSLFRHTTAGSSGVRPKGGSKGIVIRANRFEMADAGRAIQAGGSTGAEFFRFIDGDSGYEAAEVSAYGNVVIGASSAFSYANIDGGQFHHNRIERPQDWTVRILNENQGLPIVDTQNGVFTDNVVVFNDTASEWNRAVNIGPETLPASFEFARNQWFNLANPTPAGSTPNLPVAEPGGVYGVPPEFTVDEPIVWDFPWGKWVVNATEQPAGVAGEVANGRRLASGDGGFAPLLNEPLSGAWTLSDPPPVLNLAPFSQAILIDADAFNSGVTGDFDGSGVVDVADFAFWRSQFGLTGNRAADGNGDGVVDAADFTVWRDALAVAASSTAIPEPAAAAAVSLGVSLVGGRRYSSSWRSEARTE
ncbi:MAG: right-handed parallel beta-helix repeat-containing protein [Planctomycetota bacterium]